MSNKKDYYNNISSVCSSSMNVCFHHEFFTSSVYGIHVYQYGLQWWKVIQYIHLKTLKA